MKNLNMFENKRPQKQTRQFVDLFVETGSIVKSCEVSNITDKAARKIIFKYDLNKYKNVNIVVLPIFIKILMVICWELVTIV